MLARLRLFAAKFGALFGDRKSEHDFDDEMQTHVHLLTDRYIREGMTPDDAALAARRQFGNVFRHQEDRREMRAFPSLENFFHDLGLTLRQLRKTPGFSLIAIAVLALGLAANAVIFSLVNGVLLRSLPFAQPERLVALFERLVFSP